MAPPTQPVAVDGESGIHIDHPTVETLRFRSPGGREEVENHAAAVPLAFMCYNFAPRPSQAACNAGTGKGRQVMSGASRKTLASWREAHGFGILCIVSPEGEHFLVGPDESQAAAGSDQHGAASWTGLSDAQLRQYLAEKGLSGPETEDAIQLSREWATTVTGSSVFPSPLKSD